MRSSLFLFALVLVGAVAAAQETPKSPPAAPPPAAQPPAAEAPADEAWVGEVTGNDVNVRAGAGEDYRVLKRIDKGHKLVVLGHEGEFLKVRDPSTFEAFVAKTFLKVVAPGEGEVTGDRVNLRPTASMKLYPVAVLEKGSKLQVVAEDGEWVRVIAPSEVPVWVHQQFVKRIGTEAEFAAELKGLEDAARAVKRAMVKRAVEEREAGQVRTELDQRFQETDRLYQARKDSADYDFTELRGSFAKIGEEAKEGRIKDLCDLRVASIDLLRKDQEMRKKIAQIDEDHRKKLASQVLPVAAPPTEELAQGWIEKTTQLGTFKSMKDVLRDHYRLVKGGRTLFYVESDRYQLEDFLGKHVAITGKSEDRQLDFRLFKVRKIEILSQGP